MKGKNEKITYSYNKGRELLNKKISVIMPAYNLQGKISNSINTVDKILRNITKDYEIIVIDDGSTDNTYQEIVSNGNKRVIPLRNAINMGKGFSVRRGVLRSTGEYIIMLDADMEIKYSDIISYIKALKYYDIVIASKRHPKSTYDAPIMRKIASFAFNALVNILTGVRVSDTQSGLKAFRAKPAKIIMRIILVKRYAFDVEVLAIAKLLNLKICEMPVKIKLCKRFPLKQILYMLIDLLGITYRLRIIKWYQQNLNKIKAKYKPIIKL